MSSERARRRQAQILEAAFVVFGQSGYHATNIADIAAELKIGHGTFYRYFDNKLDIFRHVVLRVIEQVERTVKEHDPQDVTTALDFRGKIDAMGEALVTLVREDELLGRILFFETLGIDEEIDAMYERALQTFALYTAGVLERGLERGYLRQGINPREVAFAINGMLLESMKRAYMDRDTEHPAAWSQISFDIIFDGILPRG